MKKNLPKVIGCCLLALLFIISVGNISQAAPKSIKISGVISMTGKMAGNGGRSRARSPETDGCVRKRTVAPVRPRPGGN